MGPLQALLRELSQVKASTHGILDGESQDGASLAELETGSESAAEQDVAERAKGKSKLKTKTRKSTKRASKLRRQEEDSDEEGKKSSTVRSVNSWNGVVA